MSQQASEETYFSLPSFWFDKPDNENDDVFYQQPRMVAHIDDGTMAALTNFYRTFLPSRACILDLMSSWLSHLPTDVEYARIAGHGMNADELAANPQLSDWRVQNLNQNPELPFDDASFDRAMIVVSIQYLVQPIHVLRSVLRTLKPGGEIAASNYASTQLHLE